MKIEVVIPSKAYSKLESFCETRGLTHILRDSQWIKRGKGHQVKLSLMVQEALELGQYFKEEGDFYTTASGMEEGTKAEGYAMLKASQRIQDKLRS